MLCICGTNVLDDGLKFCPVCDKPLMDSGGKPTKYDPVEDASVDISVYMTYKPELKKDVAKDPAVKKIIKRRVRHKVKRATKKVTKITPLSVVTDK